MKHRSNNGRERVEGRLAKLCPSLNRTQPMAKIEGRKILNEETNNFRREEKKRSKGRRRNSQDKKRNKMEEEIIERKVHWV